MIHIVVVLSLVIPTSCHFWYVPTLGTSFTSGDLVYQISGYEQIPLIVVLPTLNLTDLGEECALPIDIERSLQQSYDEITRMIPLSQIISDQSVKTKRNLALFNGLLGIGSLGLSLYNKIQLNSLRDANTQLQLSTLTLDKNVHEMMRNLEILRVDANKVHILIETMCHTTQKIISKLDCITEMISVISNIVLNFMITGPVSFLRAVSSLIMGHISPDLIPSDVMLAMLFNKVHTSLAFYLSHPHMFYKLAVPVQTSIGSNPLRISTVMLVPIIDPTPVGTYIIQQSVLMSINGVVGCLDPSPGLVMNFSTQFMVKVDIDKCTISDSTIVCPEGGHKILDNTCMLPVGQDSDKNDSSFCYSAVNPNIDCPQAVLTTHGLLIGNMIESYSLYQTDEFSTEKPHVIYNNASSSVLLQSSDGMYAVVQNSLFPISNDYNQDPIVITKTLPSTHMNHTSSSMNSSQVQLQDLVFPVPDNDAQSASYQSLTIAVSIFSGVLIVLIMGWIYFKRIRPINHSISQPTPIETGCSANCVPQDNLELQSMLK